jgi:hypothetical protein
MKYTFEMGSSGIMYIPTSAIQKLMGEGIHRHTDTMEIARGKLAKSE